MPTFTDCRTFHDIPEPGAECSDEVAGLLTVLSHGYCVEVGTLMGKGARALSVGATLVDTLDPCQQCWDEREALPANVHCHFMHGVDFTPAVPIDLLFIDSGLTSRDEDFDHLAPFLAPHGLVVIDDAGLVSGATLAAWRSVTLPIGSGVIIARPQRMVNWCPSSP